MNRFRGDGSGCAERAWEGTGQRQVILASSKPKQASKLEPSHRTNLLLNYQDSRATIGPWTSNRKSRL